MLSLKRIIISAAIFAAFAAGGKIMPKITNGEVADIIEFPFLVSFQRVNVQMCSGSLLNEFFILSTSRCFINQPLHEFSIEFGESLISPGELETPNRRRILDVKLHEEFNDLLNNDISLVSPDSPINVGLHGSLARLSVPGNSKHFHGKVANVVGWGRVSPNERTNQLMKSKQTILTMSGECLEAVDDGRLPKKNNVCSMGSDSVICPGDLGSPLVYNGIVIGLASFSNTPTCQSVEGKYPNIFTDISKYIDWIEVNTGIDYQLNMFLAQ